ncbi:MAG: alanine racemase [Pseudomonadota bacterium]
MTSAACAFIDTAAIAHNFMRVRELAFSSNILAIVKADGYGHGLIRVARALPMADGFGVARLAEALALRETGVRARIVVMRGWTAPDEIAAFVHHRLDAVIHDPAQIAMVESEPPALTADLWLKVDTGMHRLGFLSDEVPSAWSRLLRIRPEGGRLRLMTHLAATDEIGDPATTQQLERIASMAASFDADVSIANSGGILAWGDARRGWVRPGLMLYGLSPFAEREGADLGLQSAMRLVAPIIAVKYLPRGAAVGYAGTWVCPVDMPVAIVGIGYGDGYPRHVPTGTPVRVGDATARVIGRVSMDMIAIDLRNVPVPRVGDPVCLWGPDLPAERIAKAAGMIPYELVTGVMPRVVRIEAP